MRSNRQKATSSLLMFFLSAKNVMSTSDSSDVGHWELNVKKLNESRRIHHLCMAESLMYIIICVQYIYIESIDNKI